MPRLAAFTALLVLGMTSCFAPTARVDLNWGVIELDGDISAVDTSGGPTTTTYASTDSLGLGDSESSIMPRASLTWAGFELMVDHQDLSFSGTGTANVDLEFGGGTISSGDDVASELDMSFTTAMVFFDIVPTDLARFGLGLGVSLVDEEITVTSLTMSPGTSVGSDEKAPVPVIGIHGGAGLGPLDIDILARGLTVDIDDVDATYVDVDAALVYSFLGRDHLSGNLRLGWRHVGLDIEYTDSSSEIALDLKSSGPYIGLGIVF